MEKQTSVLATAGSVCARAHIRRVDRELHVCVFFDPEPAVTCSSSRLMVMVEDDISIAKKYISIAIRQSKSADFNL